MRSEKYPLRKWKGREEREREGYVEKNFQINETICAKVGGKKCGGLNEGNCGLNSISNSDRNP